MVKRRRRARITRRAPQEAPAVAYLEQLRQQRDQLTKQISLAGEITKLLQKFPQLKFPIKSLLALPSSLTSARLPQRLANPHHQSMGIMRTRRAHLIPGRLCLLCNGPVKGKRATKQFCQPEHNWMYYSAKRRGPASLARALAKFRGTAATATAGNGTAGKRLYALKCEYGGHPFQSPVNWTRFCGPKHKSAFYREQRKKGLDPVRYPKRSQGQQRRKPSPKPRPKSDTKKKAVVLLRGDPLSASGQAHDVPS